MDERAVVEHRRAGRGRARRGRPSGTVRFAVLSCVAALVLAACGSSGSASPSTGAPASGGPTGSATTGSQAPMPSGAPWEVLGGGPLPVGAIVITGIAVHDDVVVAVGASANGDDSIGAQLWSSKNGGSWTAPTVAGSSSGVPRGIAVTDTGFVVVGWDGCPTIWAYGDPRGCTTAVWTSSDGTHWERLSSVAIPKTALTAVVPWNDGLLAVGVTVATATDTSETGQPALAGAVLVSPDGSSWEPLDVGGTLDGAAVMDLVVAGDTLVMAGLHTNPDGSADTDAPMHAWVSPDGATWTDEPMTGEQPAFWVALASTPSGVVASGTNPGFMGTAAYTPAWRRASGGSWVGLGLSTGWETRVFNDVAAGPDGALIAGGDQDSGAPVLYASADGEHWMLIPADGALVATPIVALATAWADGRFYLGGTVSGADGTDTYVMVGKPHMPTAEEVAAAGPEPTPTPEPVNLQATGTGTLELSAVSGFVAHPGTAQCSSVLGETVVEYVHWFDGGALRDGEFEVEVYLPSGPGVGGSAEVSLGLMPTVPGSEEFPRWHGSGTIVESDPEGLSVRVTFAGLAGLIGAVGDPLPAEWPQSLSGSASWTCGPWQGGPGPEGSAAP